MVIISPNLTSTHTHIIEWQFINHNHKVNHIDRLQQP
jgi:hypothetical protein